MVLKYNNNASRSDGDGFPTNILPGILLKAALSSSSRKFVVAKINKFGMSFIPPIKDKN